MSTDTERDWSGVTFPASTAGLFDRPLAATLRVLADEVGEDERPDRYGAGDVIEQFEARVAGLLGTPAAMFAPSGTMLQQIALRIWTDRHGVPAVGMHPTSHLEQHEFRAHEVLHGLRSVPLGSADQPLTLETVTGNAEPLGALLLELPQREIGYVLPAWDELTAMVAHARDRGWVVHLDGARLWESAPYYADHLGPVQDALPRIAELFDTVYVSTYKVLGGIAGGLLAGPEDVIGEARVWRRRHGGELIQQWPMVVAARAGLDRVLPRVAAYHEHAVAVAAVLDAVDGLEVHPQPPHTNAFRLYVHGDADRWMDAHHAVATERGLGLTRRLHPTVVPSVSVCEVVVSEDSFAVEPAVLGEVGAATAARAGAS